MNNFKIISQNYFQQFLKEKKNQVIEKKSIHIRPLSLSTMQYPKPFDITYI